jgi:hypothetical protein
MPACFASAVQLQLSNETVFNHIVVLTSAGRISWTNSAIMHSRQHFIGIVLLTETFYQGELNKKELISCHASPVAKIYE